MPKLAEYLSLNLTFTPAITAFLVRGDEILLGLRKKVTFGFGQNLISGIGGKIGDHKAIRGETAPEALVRELREEINVTVTEYQEWGTVKFIFPQKPHWNQSVQIYTVSAWQGEPQETEVIKPLWFTRSELPKAQMWDDNSIWLPKILDGQKVNMIFLFDVNNEKVEEYQ